MKLQVIASKPELESIGIDDDIRECEGELVKVFNDGWFLVEFIYEGLVVEYDLPRYMLKELVEPTETSNRNGKS